ncbi:FkbM family methyltransferase [Halocynthiibacter sp. C4]|uniref:FkbM family methyltransferase n=1 Tax=Halocynthiibacter sp. C4 TaxID=2992758 RepID=UPI00237A4412|nr:FkbM family methyltransferase [Halocynthiibacter sp. C4]MDE0588448.1 FkbM family methyltransferase [Halocynthiibacter sp. C4]
MSDDELGLTSRGIRIPLREGVITSRVKKKLELDFYETPEITGLSKFVRPSDTVLELGAGIGYVSTFLVKSLKVSEVVCVEANPVLCDYISELHTLNGVTNAGVLTGVMFPDDAAVPTSDTVPFFVTEPFWSSSLTKPSTKSYKKIEVPVYKLSKTIAKYEPTVLVCDIEGGEVDLFSKAELASVNYVFLELHTRVIGSRGVVKVFDDLHKLGFFYHQQVSVGGAVLFKRL